MPKPTRFLFCSYVLDADTGTVCGEQDPELYRGILYVCDYHRWQIEGAAREIAAKHYEWMEREYDDAFYGKIAESNRRQRRADSVVYYMECGPYVKIGVAENPLFRLNKIRRYGGVIAPKGLDLSDTRLVVTEGGGTPQRPHGTSSSPIIARTANGSTSIRHYGSTSTRFWRAETQLVPSWCRGHERGPVSCGGNRA